MLRDIDEDLDLNRIYMPLDKLDEFGIVDHVISRGLDTQ